MPYITRRVGYRIVSEEQPLGSHCKSVSSVDFLAHSTAASQVAAYGESKRIAVQLTGWQEADFSVHLSASMIAGLVTTTTTTPADVVKTRVFVGGKSGLRPWECVRDLVRREGLRGLQKGWGPNYVRLGPQTAIIFVAVEWLRKLAGLEAL